MKLGWMVICMGLGHSLMGTNNNLMDSVLHRDTSWKWELSMGFDFAQLFHLNPQQGAGQNKISLNSAIGLKSSFNRGLLSWENDLIWQFGAQKIGAGAISTGFNIPVPFQKSMDDFRINSLLGYRFKEGSEWLYSLNFGFRTIITPTFNGDDRLAGNFFKDIFSEGKSPSSKFLSPAIFTFSLGSEYKMDQGISIFYSPISMKSIVVENDFIAATGVHGNKTEGLPDSLGLYKNFEHINFQFGSFVRVNYQKDFLKGQLNYQGSLILFSNYLQNPQNIDIDMVNTLNWNFYKNFNFSLLLNLFYDDDVMVQITDRNTFGGTNKLGKRVSLTQQFLVTYQVKF